MTDAQRRRITLLEVARHAGVDPSVVSRVLSNDPRLVIRQDTRERVLRSVRDLDYRPNMSARSLRTSTAQSYGLLIPNFSNPVYASIVAGAEQEAKKRGCLLFTGSTGGRQDELDAFSRLSAARIDGLLLAGATAPAVHIPDVDVPWLFVNRCPEDSSRFVLLDDEGGARMAVEYLAELGHARIGHVAGPENVDTARRRLAGYRGAMGALGLSGSPERIARRDFTPQGGYAALESLVSRRVDVTAVLVSSVASAIGVLRAAHVLKIRIPQDLSVITIHDSPIAEYLSPSLSTVRMPLEELGRCGIELLATQPPDAVIREVVAAPMVLVARESTAPPRRSSTSTLDGAYGLR